MQRKTTLPKTNGFHRHIEPERRLECPHRSFTMAFSVQQTTDSRFIASIRIQCETCHEPFEFLGIPSKLDLNGVSTSPDRKELRAAIGTKKTLAAYYLATTGIAMKVEPEKKSTARADVRAFKTT